MNLDPSTIAVLLEARNQVTLALNNLEDYLLAHGSEATKLQIRQQRAERRQGQHRRFSESDDIQP